MKGGISWRLGLALALSGVLAAGLTGYYAYSASRQLLVSAAEQRLVTATRVLVRQLAVGLDGTARDVLMVAGHPGAGRMLLRTDPELVARNETTLAQLFRQMLETHPEYFQMRLMDAANHGLERVRVDRDDIGVTRVQGEDLQEKGHYPYVYEALRLGAGQVYVSRAVINHEVGAHAGHGKPALEVSAPVLDPHGVALGVIVINVDLNGLFGQLAADLPPSLQLYLSNAQGEYLVHPDRSKTFAFDRGQSSLVQDEFPGVRELLVNPPAQDEQTVVTRSEGSDASVQVAAFVRQPATALKAEEDFVLGLSQPLSEVLSESDSLGRMVLRIVAAFSAMAVLLAALLARALTRPLAQIVRAVEGFVGGLRSDELPTDRRDEIGMLARSIEHMQLQISGQFAKLAQKQHELDHLASHDSLTGLQNRRFFMDRLDHALAHARRDQGRLAMLFVDLDGFKEINDSVGHAAGDAVLKALALRLRHLVRESDTVARIGGDEFVILIDQVSDPEDVDVVARKIRDALAEPVQWEGRELRVGASVGVGRFPEHGQDAETLMVAADQAMYRAKSGGGGLICHAEAPPRRLP
ncbi:bifunctional diguanylate cyclase/phosphodiesterase [Roseateles flavus]|uniref:Diguanylate cyclase n=1 Tax=Roseateles flavus TaxID=3149041 RepID=A0ABV0GF52_9BURK